jgi:glycosidase
MKRIHFIPLALALLTSLHASAQKAGSRNSLNPNHVAPPHWYCGFSREPVEIIIHAPQAAAWVLSMEPYEDVAFHGTSRGASADILYVNLNVGRNARPGTLNFRVKVPAKNGMQERNWSYNLLARNRQWQVQTGLNSSDIMYLIMPDRFANGDPENDRHPEAIADVYSRDTLKGRHGGDLKGIGKHLDYLQDLGITALWLNPVQWNDQPRESYHGYAITDHYRIDPRLGSNQDYLQLMEAMRSKQMKMVMDIIPNHTGSRHWMYLNRDTGWFNAWPQFTRTNYRAATMLDPYASDYERKLNSDGWFDHHMPDLNQRNIHIDRYLTQLYLWWVEYCGLQGYRIDTYAYPDQEFMTRLCQALLTEYPQLGIFGETWVNGMGTQAWFVQNNIRQTLNSSLPGVTDFQLLWAIQHALTSPFGWNDGLNRVYATLAEDYLYVDPYKHCIFLDNHDLTRIYTHLNGDLDKWKMGITMLLTLRGIPCIYYGTEILMPGSTNPTDALVRKDFPGGFAGDSTNKFMAQGRTPSEQEAFLFLRSMAQLRNSEPALQDGKLMQFTGEDGTWVYFRYNTKKTFLIALNQQDKTRKIATARFNERLQGFQTMKNRLNGQRMPIPAFLELPPASAVIFELEP